MTGVGGIMEAGLADRLALKEACRAWRYVCWGVPWGEG